MNPYKVTSKELDRAASIVRDGGLVAFPTETYYGLGVDPCNEKALHRLFTLKNRSAIKPVLVLIADRQQIDLLASHVPDLAIRLMDRFWPGPLTIILPARSSLSSMLTGGTATIGIRLSPHPVASRLVHALGAPLTATSANLSGEPAAVTADEVYAFFGDKVDMILDGGRTPGMHGSTLVAIKQNKVECLREGCIQLDAILAFLQSTVIQETDKNSQQ